MPEVAAKLTRLFDAHLSPRWGTGFMTDDERASLADTGEQRTTDQQRHDVLAAVIDTAARSGEHPTIGGAAPTVLVASGLRPRLGRGVLTPTASRSRSRCARPAT